MNNLTKKQIVVKQILEVLFKRKVRKTNKGYTLGIHQIEFKNHSQGHPKFFYTKKFGLKQLSLEDWKAYVTSCEAHHYDYSEISNKNDGILQVYFKDNGESLTEIPTTNKGFLAFNSQKEEIHL